MATTTLPKLLANFETSLASSITAASSSLTLAVSVDNDGTTLSGIYELTIDEGTTNEEHMYVTMTGASGSISRRGLSRVDFWTEKSANKFVHNRGASVKITNFSLGLISRLLDGTDTFNANLLLKGATFNNAVDFTSASSSFRIPNLTTSQKNALTPLNGMLVYDTDLGEFQYYDGGAWQSVGTASVSNASTTVAGIVEEATVAEVGAGTGAGGTGARLFVNPTAVVKTSSGAGDENKITALGANGKLNDGFLNVATTAAADQIVKAAGTGIIDDGWIALTTAGDTVYSNGTVLTRLALGTRNQVFKAGASAPAWADNTLLSLATTDVTVTNTDVETTLFSFSLPANTLSTNKGVLVRLNVSAFNETTHTFIIKSKYGGTTVTTSGNLGGTTVGGGTNTVKGYIEFFLFGTGATNSQEGLTQVHLFDEASADFTTNKLELHKTVVGTATEDSTGALTLSITVQWSTASTSDVITIANAYAVVLN